MWTKHEYGQDDDRVDFKEPKHKRKNKVNNTIIVKVDLITLDVK
jgi:hypothetical protein